MATKTYQTVEESDVLCGDRVYQVLTSMGTRLTIYCDKMERDSHWVSFWWHSSPKDVEVCSIPTSSVEYITRIEQDSGKYIAIAKTEFESYEG